MRTPTVRKRLGGIYALLAFTVMTLMPQGIGQALASNAPEDSWRYTVTLNGTRQLKLDMPVYDEDGYDSWIDDGFVYITIQGSQKETLFHYKSWNKSGSHPSAKIYKGVDGNMTLKRDRDYSSVNVTTSETQYVIPIIKGTDYAIIHLVWDIPYKYRGKTVTISWNIHKTGNGPMGPAGESSKNIAVTSSDWNIPAAPDIVKPELMAPTLSYDVNHAGSIMVFYTMPANNITSMTAYYKEVNGNSYTDKQMRLSTEMSGNIYLPADKSFKDLYIEAHYADTEGATQTTTSETMDPSMLHQPKNLTAKLLPDGKVLLTWQISDTRWADISSNDSWELQRNTSGRSDANDAQWTGIGQLAYEDGEDIFSFTDDNLLNVYNGQPVYYRVRRLSTAAWNWNAGSGYAITKLPSTLALPAIKSATAKRHGHWTETEHSVDLAFSMGGQETDSKGRIILRTADDWEALAQRVSSKNANVDVIMAADIDISGSNTMIGSTSGNFFRGTFDGNGHTLTVHYDSITHAYAAPFQYVANLTIKNLHVAGLVRSNQKFAGGLIGRTYEFQPVTIENCRVSATVACMFDGDASNGGFVGMGFNDLIFKNCLFDGKLTGEGSHSTGGFVGAFDSGGYKATFTNCLFAPIELNTTMNDCRTFIREPRDATVNFESTYFLTPYDGRQYDSEGRLVLHNTADWELFVRLTSDANGLWDINAIMDADISITTPVKIFRGTFDGNGHTLTVNIKGDTYAAPFIFATGTSTFKNLNVKGIVSGNIHSSGLLGNSENGSTINFYNCRVSTDIITSHHYAGGFVGHGHSAKNVIRNCLFDGTITANTFNSTSYAGSFIGWEDGGTSNVVSGNLETGTYSNFNHVGLNYVNPGNAYGNTSNYNSHKWGEGTPVGNKTPQELANALGSEWTYSGNVVYPKQTITQVGQGTPAADMPSLELQHALGDSWELMGDNVVPVMSTSELIEHYTSIWDPSAKVVLTIDKLSGGNVVYTERRELTNDERKEGKVRVDLNTMCVDHEFRFSVEKDDSKLVPSASNPQIVTAVKIDEGDLKRYEFNNNVVISSPQADMLQNSVSLSWIVSSGYAEFFRIMRYDKAKPTEVTLLEKEYLQTTYIDRTVRPQHNYVYIIEGVTLCEGEHVSSLTIEGNCEPTGMVRGYVRLSNGIGLPGYTVTAKPNGTITGAKILTCVTDSTGFFEIGGLIYQKKGSYSLTVSDPNNEASFKPQSVTFDDDINLHTDIIFTQNDYYTFSGYVLYEGSSIPVSGVSFLRDGVEIINSSGKPVTTDNQGAFEVSVPQGSHQIQVVKDGHVFKNKGFFITPDAKPDSTWHDWQKDVSNIYLWDETKVSLRGRVAGGNDQGLLPLGESLSQNNLGDDLTIVLQLEGDNTSWIVRDQLDATVTERHNEYYHGKNDTTRVDSYRHRIIVHPDPKTGEYQLPLPPVKFKVTEIYAKGYPTLFQTGMVSETVDLNRYANGEIAVYSRIYHTLPTLDIWQFNGTQERYYGQKQYVSMDNVGLRDTVMLWNNGVYTLGYPVFMAAASVPMVLSAREEYHYNNELLGRLDVVQLHGGKVIANNGLVSDATTDEIELDSIGQATYVFTPNNTTFTMDNDMALHSLKFTLLYDGSYYDITPIKGYIMAVNAQPQGRRIIAGQNTHLIDILRDPPGGGSSAYIEAGSKFSYSYSADYSVDLGVNIKVGVGSGNDYLVGIWAGEGSGTLAGNLHSSDNLGTLSYNLATTYYQDWEYNYDFQTNEKISTSSNVKEVGAKSDVFIGMTDNVIVEDAIAVRAVSSKGLQRLKPGTGGVTEIEGHKFNVKGTAKVLARGWDATIGDSVFLVRDEVLQLHSKVSASFAHSQSYILEEIIPSLVRTRNALLLDSTTTDGYALALANKLERPVYVSTVGRESDLFAIGDNYKTFKPTNISDNWTDSIASLNSQIKTWVGFIALNEKEKLEATDLVKVYDFDGRSSVSYSESFNTSAGMHRYWKLPSTVNLSGTFGPSGSNKGGYTFSEDEDRNITAVGFKAGGVKFSLNITPLFGFDFNYKNGMSEGYSKQAGFNLACSRKSNLSVAVYHTNEISVDSIRKLQGLGEMGVFFKHAEDNLLDIYNGRPGSSNTTSYIEAFNKVPRFRNFVYRTLGGATSSPWEDERKTMFYNPGSVLDQKTMEIDQLRIWAKEASVSNVPYGEPARFTIYMTNESEMPDRVTNDLIYYLEDEMNPKGAKVYVDGAALTGSGINLWLAGGTIIEKQIEIYASSEYDYEDIGISFFNPEDINRIKTVKLSAHFVPSAGKINISKPGDKWVVNTESAYDNDAKTYCLPVHIDGFDVNFRGFDHIELQYKLSTQGDKDWVNVCSYYRNNEEGKALMALASGERKLMEHDGYIDATFYGENDPIEQYYDLRAVVYCRHGNGYLTSSSSILSGIKDTRRPQPFGTPQPTNGILGIGDDIKIAFSEPIAGNYLSAVNNFEVKGITNSSNISLSTALHFTGKSMAKSQVARNLAAKDFTFDMMLYPEQNGKEMVVLSHGSKEHSLKLGISADRHLTAEIEGVKFQSKKTVQFNGLHHVAYAVNNIDDERTELTFYDGNTEIGTGTINGLYYGKGNIIVGYDGVGNTSGNGFVGDMLEMRLWNKSLSSAELAEYAQRRLTGYELGLLDNYPMNEGRGYYAYDKAVGGNDLILYGATWKVPEGISMKLDGTKGIKMKSKYFNREPYQDYTLMFWFRTNSEDGTLIANGPAKQELDAKNHFNIGLEKGFVFFRSGGQQVKADTYCSEGAWHHIALTVNRSRNVGNLFIDQVLKQTFAVDTLGGINGNNLALGATYTDANTPTAFFTGNIDEVAMYEMTLPENVLKNYSTITPTGSEMGTMVYLPFSRSETQSDNSQRLMPTGLSLRQYKDNNGDIVENHRDTIILPEVVTALADRTNHAPMKNIGNLENIKFSYVTDGNNLLINLDVPDYQIEKTNVYLTVKEVADLQGNLMASPIVMDLYVYRNPLRWTTKRKIVDTMYGEGATVDLTIENLSGKMQSYSLEGLPQWITASQTSGTIAALSEEQVTLTISPYINVGTFDEVVSILGEDGMTEPLALSIRIRGEEPEWKVKDEMKDRNLMMHLVTRVIVNGEVAHNPEDILAVFGPGHEVMGMAHIDVDNANNADEGLAYLNVYYKEIPKKPLSLNFEFYDAETGRISVLKPQGKWVGEKYQEGDNVYFMPDSIIGSSTNPLVLEETYEYVQQIKLNKGWNWVSTYVQPAENTITDLLNGAATWEVGDGIEVVNDKGKGYLFTYKAIMNPDDPNSELYYWNKGNTVVTFNPRLMYRFYVRSAKNVYFSGHEVSDEVTITQGWNRVGYMSSLNLPITNALAEYTDNGSEGDIIKSQSEFAVLNIDAQGNRYWKGSLKYLRTGEGYMIRHNGPDSFTFSYPYYNTGSRYSAAGIAGNDRAPLYQNTTGSSMNVIAQVEGIELMEGDRLVAYMGTDTVGVAEANDEGLFFLTVGEGEGEHILFTIENDGEVVATAQGSMTYVENSLSGSLDNPTIISFVETDNDGAEGWHTVTGIRLPYKPIERGVYIHNGKKVIIK